MTLGQPNKSYRLNETVMLPFSSAAGTVGLSEAEHQAFQHIVTSPISVERTRRFQEDYLRSRQVIGATEKIFRRDDAFKLVTKPKKEAMFGFDVLLPKGPFVEGSNWSDMRGWDFAIAEERHLLTKLETVLVDAVKATNQVLPITIERNARAMVQAMESLANELASVGFESTALVLAADIDFELYRDLQDQLTTPDWKLPDDLRTNWIMGMHGELPVLSIVHAAASAIYAVDIHRFASLVQFSPLVELDVAEVDEATRTKLLRKGQSSAQELQMKARVRLYQSYEFQVHDKRAVFGASLARNSKPKMKSETRE